MVLVRAKSQTSEFRSRSFLGSYYMHVACLRKLSCFDISEDWRRLAQLWPFELAAVYKNINFFLPKYVLEIFISR